YQCQAENNAQNLSDSHLLGDGPDDSHRKQMEHRFSDQTQEVISTRPKPGKNRQALGSVIENVDFADDITEAQNQTAADQGRNEGSENLAQAAHDPLNHVLVRLCRLFCRVLADALNPCISGKFIVEG